MTARVPEKHKVAGVSYAVTDDGVELPVVDVTHPAFRLELSPAELAAMAEEAIPRVRRSARIPRLILRLLLRHSIIARETMAASGGFVSGSTTYLLKLGPRMLGRGYAGRIDRAIAGALSPVCIRLRLRDVARVLAEALSPMLSEREGPVHLVDIGGGTGIDALNALLLIRKRHPALLTGRRILVQVLDIDYAAPRFGAAALAALREAGAPLQGVDARFEHVQHDWNNLDGLERVLRGIEDRSIVAVSSEGGLFEYGSDQLVAANLAVLRDAAPADCVLVGSIMLDGPAARAITESGKVANRLFAADAFDALARSAGWTVDQRVGGNPVYEVLRLAKTRAVPHG